jgi:hypothetical protein
MQRRRAIGMLAASAVFGAEILNAKPDDAERRSKDHIAWVSDVLRRMLSIKPGMTRRTLLEVFTTEGGLYTGLQRTYVSRDCPYFKVDVSFQAVGRPDRDEDGRVTVIEGNDDIIVKLSRPYLQLSGMD